MGSIFNIHRFILLLKLEWFRSKKGIGMTLVILFGLIFFMDFLLGNYLEPQKFTHRHEGSYGFTLMLGGFILSSLAFGDLGNSLKRINYLTLPVSAFERFFSMWLLSSIGWIIIYTTLFTFFSVLINLLGAVLFQHITFIPFRPFDGPQLLLMKYYFVLQGIFLVGAVHFKGYVLPKTLFTLIILGFIGGFIAYFLIADLMDAEVEKSISESDMLESRPIMAFWKLVIGLFWWVLAPVTWLITYYGIKDQEV